MSQLTEVAQLHRLAYEASDSGEWVRYPCGHGGRRYVVHGRLADGYLAWCDAEPAPVPEWYLTPEAAIDHGAGETGGESAMSTAEPVGPMRYNHPEPEEARR